MAATTTTLSLTQADDWFNTQVIPKRTASAGFSGNRVWKTPRALVQGNQEDPDGLCGDAASFVYEEFYRSTGGYTTSDDYHVGVVLWEGAVLNHMANVMLPVSKKALHQYRWTDCGLCCLEGPRKYSIAELFQLHVYDLYYKKKATTLAMWWSWQDADLRGTVKVGLPYMF